MFSVSFLLLISRLLLKLFYLFFLTAGSFQSHFILTLVCPFLEMTLVPETGKISSFLPHSRCKICASSQLLMKARLAAGRGWWDTVADFPSFLVYFTRYCFICWLDAQLEVSRKKRVHLKNIQPNALRVKWCGGWRAEWRVISSFLEVFKLSL